MRKTIPLALLLLACMFALASAAGTNLRWTACVLDGGVLNRAFACNSNVGSNILIGSFVLDTNLSQVNGDELIVDLVSATPTLPDWWQFRNVGSCRQTAITIAAQDGPSCPDPFAFQASMNIAAYVVGTLAPNTARLLCANAVTSDQAVDLVAGEEYTAARWSINNSKTVGTGACNGCVVPVCILFSSANLTTVDNLNDTKFANGADPGSNFVSWQGGDYLYLCYGTPTKNSTWGAVKSLYR
jgi:hypothetical protein